METIEMASQWWEQLHDEYVQAGLRRELSDGPSLEEQVKTALGKVEAAESKVERREKIEGISPKDRNDEQNLQLKGMASLKTLTEAATSSKTTLRDLEKKLEDSNRKNKEIVTWVHVTVSEPLWRVFRITRQEHDNNVQKQVIMGIRAIKDRMQIAPNAVLAAHKAKISEFTKSYAVTIPGALQKLNNVDAIFTTGKELEKFLGKTSGSLTDDEAITAMIQGIKYKQGEGNVTQSIQDVLDLAGETKKTWKVFCSELRKMLETANLRMMLDTDKKIEEEGEFSSFNTMAIGSIRSNKAFAAAVDEAAETKLRNWQIGNQQQGFSGAFNAVGPQSGPSWQGVQSLAPYAFNAGMWQQPPTHGSESEDRQGGGSKGNGLCFAFQKGKCDRGESCRFKHSNADGPKAKGISNNICYSDGSCTRAGCPFAHPSGRGSNRPDTPTAGQKRK